MTRDQAQAEAVRRWGPKAWTNIVLASRADGDYVPLFVVGCPTLHRKRKRVWGGGWSWQAAFADADTRRKE